MRFIMNTGRTTRQGQQINIGKDHPEYQTIVSTMSMHPEDMKLVGVVSGGEVRARSEYGEATFRCVEGNVPRGMVFVPYGPPTCRVMGTYTDGTGMPTSKGWEIDVEPVQGQTPGQTPGQAPGQTPGQAPGQTPWEMIEPGRYMPRRTRGSFPGRELG